jgi:histidinol phosphatase-like PHP family hydrolase
LQRCRSAARLWDLAGERIVGEKIESDVGVVATAAAVGEAVRDLDLKVDAHVHTGFAAGRDSVGVIVTAADRAGLSGVTFADQVGPDTAWLPAYADAVRRAQQRTEMTLRVAAEVEVVQQDGWLAWPVDLGDLEAVSVAVSRLPLAGGAIGPREVRTMLLGGLLDPARVTEIVVETTIRGLERATRYAPAQLARPLSLLTQVGIDDSELTPELFGALADACRSTNTTVEVSEAWRSPSARLIRMFREAGVSLIAASDARYAAEVGRWQYVTTI